ncbi:fimbrial protein [Salmonella enterica subsp. enterica serovar Bredeney]|nr:fimbrial protein [Salmonella enterica subsp. enterica serovar Bredeney]
MNKTLIALAVVISAAASGSAMAAWDAHGLGKAADFGGALTPTASLIPWEVQVGSAVTDLNSSINKGDKVINIVTSKNIPILGIRTKTNSVFAGTSGISPQISYGSAIKVSEFEQSKVPLTLEVKNSSDTKIGELKSSVSASSLVSVTSSSYSGAYYAFSPSAGAGFFGGLPTSKDKVSSNDLAKEIMPEIADNYANQGLTATSVESITDFKDHAAKFSGYYASGIKSGDSISITLDSPVADNTNITWKASLPVTVSYQ